MHGAFVHEKFADFEVNLENHAAIGITLLFLRLNRANQYIELILLYSTFAHITRTDLQFF